MCKTFFLLAALAFTGGIKAQSIEQQAASLAQQQLDAYNKRDIEAFLLPYADSVAVYDYPGKLLYTGKAEMRRQYAGMFAQLPDLHCTLVKRIVLGNIVIDEESVIFNKNRPAVRAIAIYTITGNKISEVRFISR
ncbi:MAG TPA: nuclear transport factor 2 family protein [Chitinophagaceae bacterium]|nr:nuclear transport factor 2 family protein [Chitinophagaceae bacterium]